MAASETPDRMIYTGPSMTPTLRQFDTLILTHPDKQTINRGDIIVFKMPGKTTPVIHRVISVEGDSYRTRGDYNNKIDPYIVQKKDIQGLVRSIERKGRLQNLKDGETGYRLAASGILRIRRNLDYFFSNLLHPLYIVLSKSGIFRLFLPVKYKLKVFEYMRSNGIEYQLFLGDYHVGRRLPGESEWHIKRPFRLFIDEKKLPKK